MLLISNPKLEVTVSEPKYPTWIMWPPFFSFKLALVKRCPAFSTLFPLPLFQPTLSVLLHQQQHDALWGKLLVILNISWAHCTPLPSALLLKNKRASEHHTLSVHVLHGNMLTQETIVFQFELVLAKILRLFFLCFV